MSYDRVPFGIPKLDEVLNGGIPKGNLVLVSGGAGTGKTTLALQFLIEGAKNGEKSLYFSTEQDQNELIRQGENYGWPLGEFINNGSLKVVYLDILSEENYLSPLDDALTTFQPTRVVVDSLNTLADYAAVYDFAKRLLLKQGGVANRPVDQVIPLNVSEKTLIKRMLGTLLAKIKSPERTVLLISELPEKGETLSNDGISEFLADGVILVDLISGFGKGGLRNIRIRKMRYTKHITDSLPFEMTSRGIEVSAEG